MLSSATIVDGVVVVVVAVGVAIAVGKARMLFPVVRLNEVSIGLAQFLECLVASESTPRPGNRGATKKVKKHVLPTANNAVTTKTAN